LGCITGCGSMFTVSEMNWAGTTTPISRGRSARSGKGENACSVTRPNDVLLVSSFRMALHKPRVIGKVNRSAAISGENLKVKQVCLDHPSRYQRIISPRPLPITNSVAVQAAPIDELSTDERLARLEALLSNDEVRQSLEALILKHRESELVPLQ